MSITEMWVNIDCHGCEKKIKKALKKVQGVDSVEIDIQMQKVTVMGWANRQNVLRAVKKLGKTVVWPYPYQHNGFIDEQQCYYTNRGSSSSLPQPLMHQYYANGRPYEMKPNKSYSEYQAQEYNPYGYYQGNQYPTNVIGMQSSSVFSDDNPHACVVM